MSNTDCWKRYDVWDEQPLASDSFVDEIPEAGFCAMSSPYDPSPSLTIENGRIVEMDGVGVDDFDMIDTFIAEYYIDLDEAEHAMSVPSTQMARMMVDISVPREHLVKIAGGMTPAKLAEVMGCLSAAEMTMAQVKLRARREPGNQAHVTNAKDDPLQMAADAATAAIYGFDEMETTVRVAGNGRSSALALAIGGAVVRGGVLVQCSIEEAEELSIGMSGLTTYTETMSVYGTEQVFIDGDDTPWSKAFLTAAYASRGLKARCTSGGGAELLMAFHDKKSMLYLETRCLCLQKAIGIQGTQNGGIDGVYLVSGVPGGMRELVAENVLAALLDLECASGNDGRASNSAIRNGAHVLPMLLAGSDFICSGFGSIEQYDNTFGGSLFDANEMEDFLAMQRDFMVDGGLRHVDENEVMQARSKAIDATAAVLEALELAEIRHEQRQSVLVADGSKDTDSFTLGSVAEVNRKMVDKNIAIGDVIKALADNGFEDVAENMMMLARQRIAGDYLQTSAIMRDGKVISAVNHPNQYSGPGTGYAMSEHRKTEISRMRRALDLRKVLEDEARAIEGEGQRFNLVGNGAAVQGKEPREVVIGISPAFDNEIHKTTGGCHHPDVLQAIMDGIRRGGCLPRVVRIHHTADTAFLGLTAARLAGSGIGIGIQAKGTTVIHKSDLSPLHNLELFSMAPLLTLKHYAAIGQNAAQYAIRELPEPIAVDTGVYAIGAKYHVRTALLYSIEAGMTSPDAKPEEISVVYSNQ